MKDEITEVLKAAQSEFEAGNLSSLTRLLEKLNEEHGEDSFRCFCIGRNFRYQADLGRATEWLTRSIALKPFSWSFYELGFAEEQGGKTLEAGKTILLFLESEEGDANARGYNETHKATILRIAHAVFNSDDRETGLSIYQKAESIGIADYLSSLRIIEHLLNSNQIDDATARMSALHANFSLDGWGFLALSRVHQLAGEAALSREALRSAVAGGAGNQYLLIQTCHRLIELEMFEDADLMLREIRAEAAAKANGKDLSPQTEGRLLGLELRLATRAHDTARMATLLAERSNGWKSLDKWVLIEAILKFALPGQEIQPDELAIADELRVHLEKGFTGAAPEVNALLHFYGRRRMWPEAERLLEDIKGLPIYCHPDVVIRRFEFRCFVGDLEGAEAVYREHLVGKDLSNWACSSVIRFLAERKQWSEAAKVLQLALSKGYSFPGAEHMLLEVARRADFRAELVAALDGAIENGGPEFPTDALAFRQMLVDDLCIRTGNEVLPGKGRKGPPRALSRWNRVL